MKCPNCGTELQSELYRKMRPGHYAPQICYFCPNGDFGTDYTYPTRAIAEIESAYNWNAQKEAKCGNDRAGKEGQGYQGIEKLLALRKGGEVG